MKIEILDINSVVPYEKNPRKITDKAVSKVAKSLKEFGFRQPIVLDKNKVVVAGHTRLKAAHLLGLKQVPVLIAADLTDAQTKAYRIADNRTGEETFWEDESLSLELKDLEGLDFDLDILGFDSMELDALLIDKEEDERAEETPEIPEDPISVLGDVWILGKHRLVCGDSTQMVDVDKCLNGITPHLMVTDPPYGVNYDANWRNEAVRDADGKKGVIGGRAIGKVENDDKADWREVWSLFPGDVAYIWHAGVHAASVQQSLEASGFKVRTQIIWTKNNIVIGRGDYHWQHEPCWYAVREKKTGHWNGDRKQSTIWKIDKPLKSETGHSTQKPIECMRRPILNNSSQGHAIYDPFCGSGTTIIACEMTGRECLSIELNPAYVDVSVERWQNFAEAEAIHEATGKTYNSLAKDRRS